jgi:hypothetical protein
MRRQAIRRSTLPPKRAPGGYFCGATRGAKRARAAKNGAREAFWLGSAKKRAKNEKLAASAPLRAFQPQRKMRNWMDSSSIILASPMPTLSASDVGPETGVLSDDSRAATRKDGSAEARAGDSSDRLAERLAWAGERGQELAKEPWAARAWEKLEQAQWAFALLRAMGAGERPSELWGVRATAENGEWSFGEARADASAPPPKWAKLAEGFARDWACEHAGELAVRAQELGGGKAWLEPSKLDWQTPGLPSRAKPSGLLLAALVAAAKRAAPNSPLAQEILPELLALEERELTRRPAPRPVVERLAPAPKATEERAAETPARGPRPRF